MAVFSPSVLASEICEIFLPDTGSVYLTEVGKHTARPGRQTLATPLHTKSGVPVFNRKKMEPLLKYDKLDFNILGATNIVLPGSVLTSTVFI